MVDLFNNIENGYLYAGNPNDDFCEEDIKIIKKTTSESLDTFLEKEIKPKLEKYKKNIDFFDIVEDNGKYYLVIKKGKEYKKLYELQGIDKNEFQKLSIEFKNLKKEIKKELTELKNNVSRNEKNEKYIYLTKKGISIDLRKMSLEDLIDFTKKDFLSYSKIEPILDRKIEELYKKLGWDGLYEYGLQIKEKNKDLYYEILKILILKISNKDQYKKIISLPTEDLINAFKRFSLDKNFVSKYEDIYLLKQLKCRNQINPKDCHILGSFYFTIKSKYKLSEDNYVDDVLLYIVKTPEGKEFVNQLEQLVNRTNQIKDFDKELGYKIHTKGVIGALQDFLNQYPEGNKTAKDIILFIAEVAPIFVGVYAIFKLLTKYRWFGLALLIEELTFQATKGTSLVEMLWKLYYGGWDQEFDRLKGAKQSMNVMKINEIYRKFLSYPAFVDFMVGDWQIKDIKKFFKVENGNFKVKDFKKFLDSFPVDDVRRELLLKMQQQIGIDGINKIFDIGFKNMGIEPQILDKIEKSYGTQKIDEYFQNYQNKLKEKLTKEKKVVLHQKEINNNVIVHPLGNIDEKSIITQKSAESNQTIKQSKSDQIGKGSGVDQTKKQSSTQKAYVRPFSEKSHKENQDLIDEGDQFFDNLTDKLFFEEGYGGLYVLIRGIQTGAIDPKEFFENKEWSKLKWSSLSEGKVPYILDFIPKKVTYGIDKLNFINKLLNENTKKGLYNIIDKDLEAIDRWLKDLQSQFQQHNPILENEINNVKKQKQLLEQIKQAIQQGDTNKLNRLILDYTQNFDNTFRNWYDRITRDIITLDQDVAQKQKLNLEGTYRQIERKLQNNNLSFRVGDVFEVELPNKRVNIAVVGIDQNNRPIFALVENGKIKQGPLSFDVYQSNLNLKYVGNYRLNRLISARDKYIDFKRQSVEDLEKQYEELQQEKEKILEDIKKKEEELAKKYNGKIPKNEKEALKKELVDKVAKYNDKMLKLNIRGLEAIKNQPPEVIKKNKFLRLLDSVNPGLKKVLKENRLASRSILGIGMITIFWSGADWLKDHPEYLLKAGADIGIGFIPLAGNFRDGYWAYKGEDPITGKEMSTTERVVRVIFAIPVIGNFAKVVKLFKYGKDIEKIEKAVKDAEKIDDIISSIKSDRWIRGLEVVSETARLVETTGKVVTYGYLGVAAVSGIFDLTDMVKTAIIGK